MQHFVQATSDGIDESKEAFVMVSSVFLRNQDEVERNTPDESNQYLLWNLLHG